jgi:hypothetical protein
MQVLYDLNWDKNQNSYEFLNAVTASATYGFLGNQFRNGFGNKSLRDATQSEAPLTQMVRSLSGFDLYMTSMIKRISQKQQYPTHATIILSPGFTKEPGGSIDDAGMDARGFVGLREIIGLEAMLGMASNFNPFSMFNAYQIPADQLDYSGGNFANFQHANFGKSARLRQVVKRAVVNRYQQVVDGWNRTASSGKRLFYLANLYSPLAMMIQAKLGTGNEDSYLYGEFYLPAPGFLARDQANPDDVSKWTLDGYSGKLPPKSVVRTTVAVLDTVTYAGASMGSRDRFPVIKVAFSKRIKGGAFSSADAARDYDGAIRVSMGAIAQSDSSEQAGDLIDISAKNADEVAPLLSGALGINYVPNTPFGALNNAATKVINNLNKVLNQVTLKMKVTDFMLALRRPRSDSVQQAFRQPKLLELVYDPKENQGLEVELNWPKALLDDHLFRPIAEFLEKPRQNQSDKSGVKNYAMTCPGDRCSLVLPIHYFDNTLDGSLGLVGTAFKFVKDQVKAQVAASANKEIPKGFAEADKGAGEALTSILGVIETNRREMFERFAETSEAAKAVANSVSDQADNAVDKL